MGAKGTLIQNGGPALCSSLLELLVWVRYLAWPATQLTP